jgi:hypothetical protein
MNLDASVNNQLTRNDFAIIIALNRHLATLLPVRLKNISPSDYLAGTVLGRASSGADSGLYKAYASGNTDGSQVAAAILFEDVRATDVTNPQGTGTGTSVARGIFGGEVFQDKLIGFDANAKSNLNGTTIVDASGVNVLKF